MSNHDESESEMSIPLNADTSGHDRTYNFDKLSWPKSLERLDRSLHL